MADEFCPLCDRILGTVNIDRHHLVPKCRGGKSQEKIHRICHRKIHASFTEKELERQFSSWDELKTHPLITDFVAWVQKKSPDFYNSTSTSNRKR